MVSLPDASRAEMTREARMCFIETLEPMNMKRHSGGTTEVMCANRAGRWGIGRVSTRKASLVGSNGEGGDEGEEEGEGKGVVAANISSVGDATVGIREVGLAAVLCMRKNLGRVLAGAL